MDFDYMSRRTTKPTKWHVRPAKTQISLGIRPIWSESSLSAWRNLGPLASHWAHSEDWSDCADAQTDLSLRWAHMSFYWFCHEVAQLSFPDYYTYYYFNIAVVNLDANYLNNGKLFWKKIWAASWQNQQSVYAPSEDSDQPGHPPSLIRVFAVRSMGS